MLFREKAFLVLATGFVLLASLPVLAAPPAPPVVDSPTSADIGSTTATLGGTMTDPGNGSLTGSGVEWGTTDGGPYPNIVPNTADVGAGSGIPLLNDPFAVAVDGLPPGQTIYFRAYVTNDDKGGQTGYSPQGFFDTLSGVTAPTVTSPTFSAVTGISATLGGTMTNDNGTPVSSCGVVWDTTSWPDGQEDQYPLVNEITDPAGACSVDVPFDVDVSDLPPDSTIFFRAWADNGAKGYTSEASFQTDKPPTLTANDPPAAITANSATLGGSISDDGGDPPTLGGQNVKGSSRGRGVHDLEADTLAREREREFAGREPAAGARTKQDDLGTRVEHGAEMSFLEPGNRRGLPRAEQRVWRERDRH